MAASSVRSKKIPAIVTITITGEDKRMLTALKEAIRKVNWVRKSQGEEEIPYIINHNMSTLRPSILSQDIASKIPSGSKASTITLGGIPTSGSPSSSMVNETSL